MRRAVQWTVQGAFWILAGCALFIALALPATLAKLVFGSPV
jgi:hypothetical protein